MNQFFNLLTHLWGPEFFDECVKETKEYMRQIYGLKQGFEVQLSNEVLLATAIGKILAREKK